MTNSIISMAGSLFIVINVIGNIPLYLSLVKSYSPQKQRRIFFRELLIGLFILLLFGFSGDAVLNVLGIDQPTISIAGGILLFIIGLGMIFPHHAKAGLPHHEPMIVPMATPTFAGPGSISLVMVFATQLDSYLATSLVVLLAWLPSIALLLISSNLKSYLGEKGLLAAERLGGMLVTLFSIHMISKGVIALVKANFP